MSSQEATIFYAEELTEFEKCELLHWKHKVYTIGEQRVHDKTNYSHSDGNYFPTQGSQLGYRYIIDRVMGAGAFGQVLRCRDMSENGRIVAIKISKYGQSETDNAQIEARILNKISNSSQPDEHHLVQIFESFKFRGYFFIVTEMLELDLYNYLKKRSFDPVPGELLRAIAK